VTFEDVSHNRYFDAFKKGRDAKFPEARPLVPRSRLFAYIPDSDSFG